MLTSVAYRPGRVPATQQQSPPVCLPHTIFTLYVNKPRSAAAACISRRLSRSGWVWRSAFACVWFVAISTSAKDLRDEEYEHNDPFNPRVYELAHTPIKMTSRN